MLLVFSFKKIEDQVLLDFIVTTVHRHLETFYENIVLQGNLFKNVLSVL